LAGVAVLATTCASPTKPDPVVELGVQSISPAAGPAAGGTEVTIRGTGFAAGLGVTIGGRAASDVSVRGNDMLTAKTPASAIAGVVDIAVSLNGRTGTLAGGFRYEPLAPNTSPVIRSMTAQGRRVRQPSSFADYGETIQITLVVEDSESAPTQLTYQWRACGGSFVGTGPVVDWTAPPLGTLPSTCTIEVTVLDGPHFLNRSIVVRLHNSVEEVRSMVVEFLEEFANSTVAAATTVRNFSNSCPGKAAELSDVTRNRATRRINAHLYGPTAVTVAFGSACKSRTVDACAVTSVEWNSTVIATGAAEIAKGTSTITGIYRDSRWWLCDSSFDGASSLGLHFLH
jgi:IPT/TIG domain